MWRAGSSPETPSWEKHPGGGAARDGRGQEGNSQQSKCILTSAWISPEEVAGRAAPGTSGAGTELGKEGVTAMDIVLTLSAYCVPGPELTCVNSPIIPATQ